MLGLVGILSIVAVLLSAVAFAASIWLVVVAFKRSTLWGLLTLVVPFAAVVFAVKFWQEARRPFLASAVAGAASTLLFFTCAGLAASSVSRELAGAIASDALLQNEQPDGAAANGAGAPAASQTPEPAASATAEDRAEPAALRSLSSATAVPPLPRPDSAKLVYDPGAVTSDGYAPVALRDAARVVGRHVKLVTTGGRVHRGEMLRADANGVTIERWLRGGSAVVDFRKSEIETLQVDVN